MSEELTEDKRRLIEGYCQSSLEILDSARSIRNSEKWDSSVVFLFSETADSVIRLASFVFAANPDFKVDAEGNPNLKPEFREGTADMRKAIEEIVTDEFLKFRRDHDQFFSNNEGMLRPQG